MRSRISSAALLVNVTARIFSGRDAPLRIRYAMRWTITRVLPLPAPARTRAGPSPCSTASRCSGLRFSRISMAGVILAHQTLDFRPQTSDLSIRLRAEAKGDKGRGAEEPRGRGAGGNNRCTCTPLLRSHAPPPRSSAPPRLGANIFRDLFAGVRDVVGGRSGAYEKVLERAREIALQEMEEAAKQTQWWAWIWIMRSWAARKGCSWSRQAAPPSSCPGPTVRLAGHEVHKLVKFRTRATVERGGS